MRRHLRSREFGDVLRLPPRWTRLAYPLVLAIALAAVLILVGGRMNRYARGPAVVRVEGRQTVFSLTDGTIDSVEAAPGDTVVAGQVLVRLHAEEEQAALTRARQEFDLFLAERLRDPSSEAARTALLPRRAGLDFARLQVEAKILRTPRSGVIREVRARPGQLVRAGDLLVSLVADDARYTLLALLPASFRPELRPGMPLHVEPQGYPHATVTTSIEHLGDQAVGPAEARRVLGPALADAVDVSGAVVLARATLPGPTFDTLDGRYPYHDGMVVAAEVPVRSERLIFTLLPGLRRSMSN